MNAFDVTVLAKKAPASGVYPVPSASEEVRHRFVENWGRLAATFGMPRDLGRIHAQLFLHDHAQDVMALAQALNLDGGTVRAHLGALLDWGVVKVSRNSFGHETYATARDPWDFFLEIVRQRHRREFLPILELIRETASLARQMSGTNPSDAGTSARVELFSKFVEDLSRLIEVFVRVGSKPMAMALKTFAKMAPRA